MIIVKTIVCVEYWTMGCCECEQDCEKQKNDSRVFYRNRILSE